MLDYATAHFPCWTCRATDRLVGTIWQRSGTLVLHADMISGLRWLQGTQVVVENASHGDFMVLLANKLHSFAQRSVGRLDESI
jgi:hypothetical protein